MQDSPLIVVKNQIFSINLAKAFRCLGRIVVSSMISGIV